MLRNISKEQEELLSIIDLNPSYKKCLDSICEDRELLSVMLKIIDNKNGYLTYLKEINEDRELEEQMSILSTFKFMEYIRDNGFLRLLRLINDLSKKSILTIEKKIEYVEKVFEYIDFLIYRDEITDTVSGKRMREDAIEALRELKYLVEDEKNSELIKKNEEMSVLNTKLLEDNGRLTSENNSLTHLNISLNEANNGLIEQRDALKSELDLLNNQIENRRMVLQSGLDEEISASRVKRISDIEDEMVSVKNDKNNEINILEKRKLELEGLIDKLSGNIEQIKQDMEGIPNLFSSCSSKYDVIWEPISDEHILYSQNHWTIKDFVNKLKIEYMFKTGKSKEQCEKDFNENSPFLDELINFLESSFNNDSVIGVFSIRNIINYSSWNAVGKERVVRLKLLLGKLKLPVYKERINSNNINISNNFIEYLMNLEVNSKLAESLMREKIIESKYLSLIKAVKDIIPEGYDFGSYSDIVEIDDAYKLERKRP